MESAIEKGNEKVIDVLLQHPRLDENLKSVFIENRKRLPEVSNDLLNIASSLKREIENLIVEIQSQEPKKGSREEKQLKALLSTKNSLIREVNSYESNELSISATIKKVENLTQVINNIQEQFDRIGYPGKFKVFLDKCKIAYIKILNLLPGVGVVHNKSKILKKEDTKPLILTAFTLDLTKKNVLAIKNLKSIDSKNRPKLN